MNNDEDIKAEKNELLNIQYGSLTKSSTIINNCKDMSANVEQTLDDQLIKLKIIDSNVTKVADVLDYVEEDLGEMRSCSCFRFLTRRKKVERKINKIRLDINNNNNNININNNNNNNIDNNNNNNNGVTNYDEDLGIYTDNRDIQIYLTDIRSGIAELKSSAERIGSNLTLQNGLIETIKIRTEDNNRRIKEDIKTVAKI